MRSSLEDARANDEKLMAFYERNRDSRFICASSNRLPHHQKIFLNHVNDEMHRTIQANYAMDNIKGQIFEVLNTADMGT